MQQLVTRTRVLIVEDDPDNLEALSIILSRRYAVFPYASGAEALAAIDAVKPDVLVLDIGMHPVDGVQCLTAVRAIPAYRGVPAIALTGYARADQREKFLAGGFQAVVAKPLPDAETLITMISDLATVGSAIGRLDGFATLTASSPGEPEQTRRCQTA